MQIRRISKLRGLIRIRRMRIRGYPSYPSDGYGSACCNHEMYILAVDLIDTPLIDAVDHPATFKSFMPPNNQPPVYSTDLEVESYCVPSSAFVW